MMTFVTGDVGPLIEMAVKAEREACAKICEQIVHVQHPIKAAGVPIFSAPPSIHHAAIIRARKSE